VDEDVSSSTLPVAVEATDEGDMLSPLHSPTLHAQSDPTSARSPSPCPRLWLWLDPSDVLNGTKHPAPCV
jgi:hypothetical protein